MISLSISSRHIQKLLQWCPFNNIVNTFDLFASRRILKVIKWSEVKLLVNTVISPFHHWTLKGNLSLVKLNSTCYFLYCCGEKIKFCFHKLNFFVFHLTWIIPSNYTETNHFHGNGPYCKIATKNQPTSWVFHLSLRIACQDNKINYFEI